MAIRSKLFSFIVFAFAFAAFSIFAFAQETTTESATGSAKDQRLEKRQARGDRRVKRGGEERGFRGPGRMGPGELRGIDLSEEQRAQLKAIHEANKPSQETLELTKTLLQAKRSGTITPDQEVQLKQLKGAAKEKAFAIRQQIEGILTPEQKAQIEARKQEMRQRMQERRQQRKPRDPKQETPVEN